MLQVVALLCALSVSPRDCDRRTAIDYIPLGTAANEIECMMGGQMTIAGLAIRADLQARWIVKCIPPTGIGRDSVG